MKVYKITPCPQCNSYCESSMKAAIDGITTELEESETGDIITIEVIEMTEQEYDSLPEYDGA